MIFYPGLHQPHHAQHFARCMVSVNRLWKRRSGFIVGDWMLDSGAFTEITTHGGYRFGVDVYANEIRRWKSNGRLLCATTQDFMCETFVLKITGKTVAEHQHLTIERYDALLTEDTGVYILPVLQGYAPSQYVEHLEQYGKRLAVGAWVGVGSVCKRNASPQSIVDVLMAIKQKRPDLRLHTFGLKTTALQYGFIRSLIYSADSMAWSFAARRNGRSANDWKEATLFVEKIRAQRLIEHGYQHSFLEAV